LSALGVVGKTGESDSSGSDEEAEETGEQWWFLDASQIQQGPFGLEVLQAWLTSSQLPPTTLVWKEGLAEWISLETAVAQIGENPIIALVQPSRGDASNPCVHGCGRLVKLIYDTCPGCKRPQTLEDIASKLVTEKKLAQQRSAEEEHVDEDKETVKPPTAAPGAVNPAVPVQPIGKPAGLFQSLKKVEKAYMSEKKQQLDNSVSNRQRVVSFLS
jgi:hypothetical protein